MARFDTFKAVSVRVTLCLHFLIVVWRVTKFWGSQYWPLAAAIIPFVFEGLHTISKRHSIEQGFVSLCFLFYLCATLPGIWLLELHRTNACKNATDCSDNTDNIFLDEIGEDTWAMVIEELMLYLMILGRWILPRGGVGREQLSHLLFAFIGIASDIMELFSLFGDKNICKIKEIKFALLGVWSWSVLQFSFTFHMSSRPSRERERGNSGITLSFNSEVIRRRATIHLELVVSLVTLLMQDGPFLVLRLYTMINYNLMTYSLLFFTAKNVIVILLLIYKSIILLSKRFCPNSHDSPNENVLHSQSDNTIDDSTNVISTDGEAPFVTDLEMTITGIAALAKNTDKTRGIANNGNTNGIVNSTFESELTANGNDRGNTMIDGTDSPTEIAAR